MKANPLDVTFIGSFEFIHQCPPPKWPEYAFIGRSNVGKSSLINSLCAKHELARVSQVPGKTQHLNYFLVEKNWYLVDLPGYGYARRPKKLREAWEKTMFEFLVVRDSIVCVFLLVDSNVSPQKSDLEMAAFLGEHSIPFVIIFTKIDRQKPREADEAAQNFFKAMEEDWEEFPQHFMTAAEKDIGREDILKFIHKINDEL